MKGRHMRENPYDAAERLLADNNVRLDNNAGPELRMLWNISRALWHFIKGVREDLAAIRTLAARR